jgi:hypothetical protein
MTGDPHLSATAGEGRWRKGLLGRLGGLGGVKRRTELKDQGAAEDFGSLGCKRKWTKRVEGKEERFCIF